MDNDFRSAVFTLCKKLYKNTDAKHIREVIHNISVVISKDDNENVALRKPKHGDLAMIGSDQRIQFLGYILADDAVDEINNTPPFIVNHLDNDERELIELAHNTLDIIIKSCISDICCKYQKISPLLNPYSLCRTPKHIHSSKTIINDNDLNECVKAFRNGRIYNELFSKDNLRLFEKVDNAFIQQLVLSQQNMFKNDFNDISIETKEYYLKANNPSLFKSTDVLLLFTIYCYALRKSLSLACQMLFESILGLDMLVFNNDNIIKLSDRKSDFIYNRYTVLSQNLIIDYSRRGIGSLALLSCTTEETDKIKEFCEIGAYTYTFSNELGNTSKFKMMTVDNELNPIHKFTDYLMNSKLGKCSLKQI